MLKVIVLDILGSAAAVTRIAANKYPFDSIHASFNFKIDIVDVFKDGRLELDVKRFGKFSELFNLLKTDEVVTIIFSLLFPVFLLFNYLKIN